MIVHLVFGLLAMSICLAIQACSSVIAVRHFARTANESPGLQPWWAIFVHFSTLMILLMLGNILQVMCWALFYIVLGSFDDFEAAVYFSGVTFTSLGYGDVVLDSPTRLLGPLQAANGLMMFGITTAVFIAAIQQAVAKRHARSEAK